MFFFPNVCRSWLPATESTDPAYVDTIFGYNHCVLDLYVYAGFSLFATAFLLLVAVYCNRTSRVGPNSPIASRALSWAPVSCFALCLTQTLLRLVLCLLLFHSLLYSRDASRGYLLSSCLRLLKWTITSVAALLEANGDTQLGFLPRGHVPWSRVVVISALLDLIFSLVFGIESLFSSGRVVDSLLLIADALAGVLSVFVFLVSLSCSCRVSLVERLTSPRPSVSHADPEPSRENGASLTSLMFFSWLRPLIDQGRRRPLEINDLWDLYPGDKFASCNRCPSAQAGPDLPSGLEFCRGMSLFKLLWREVKWHVIKQWVTGILGALLAFAGPYSLNLFLEYLKSTETKANGKSGSVFFNVAVLTRGLVLIGGYYLALLLRSMLDNASFFRGRRVGTRLRAIMMGLIYRKALKTPARALDPTIVLNLMQTDSPKITEMMNYSHYMFTAPMQILIAVFWLHKLIGYAALAGYLALFCAFPINALLSKRVSSVTNDLMEKFDMRVSKTHEFLQSIGIIKFFAWEPKILEMLGRLRDEELKSLRWYYVLSAALSVIWLFMPLLVVMPAIAVHVLALGNILDSSILYTTMSLFSLLRIPLLLIPMLIMYTFQARTSSKRITDFLTSDENVDLPTITDSKAKSPIVLKNASFSWAKNDLPTEINESEEAPLLQNEESNASAPTLKSLSCEIPYGKLTVVIGRTACGRSSFLQAILGEIRRVSGTVARPAKIAYVAQKPCLLNASVRENITFGSEYNKSRLQKALFGCALDKDLSELSDGELTEVGEHGCNLSGGQRARLDLCRAAYSNCDTILMDDVLSALDAPTSKHVFEKCILGIMGKKTRILVTHSFSLVLEKADYVIFIDKGEIKFQGRPEDLPVEDDNLCELLQSGGLLQSQKEPEVMLTAFESEENTPRPETSIQEKTPKSLNVLLTSKSQGYKSEDSPSISGFIIDEAASPTTAPRRLVEEEDRCRGSVTFGVYKAYVKAAGGIPFIVFMLALLVAQNVFLLLQDLCLRAWVQEFEKNTTAEKNAPVDSKYYMLMYMLLFLVAVFLMILRVFVEFHASLRASKILLRKLLSALFGSKVQFFERVPFGRIMSRVSKDMQTIDRELTSSLIDTASQFLQLITISAVTSWVSPLFLLFLIPIAYSFWSVGIDYMASSRELKRLDSLTRSPIFTLATESLNGVVTVRAYGRGRWFFEVMGSAVDTNHRAFFYMWAVNRWLSVRTDVIGSTIIALTGVLLILTKSSIDTPLAGLTMVYVMGATDCLLWLIRFQALSEMNLNSVERVGEWIGGIQGDPNIARNLIEQESSDGLPAPQGWPRFGSVKVSHLSASYTANEAEQRQYVLKDLNFSIEPGTKLAICGRTGAGKTSLTKALFRFIPHIEGTVEIDGVDLANLRLHDMRSALSVVPQEPVLFSGTIRSNLDVFDEYSDADIAHAMQVTGLTERNIQSSDEVRSQGSNFSVGTRQLIGLARVLLRKSRVLVLDEATSSVDSETDAMMQRIIREQFGRCTLITIAHRLATIIDYDMVLLLEKGSIVQKGSPRQLLEKGSGPFYEMCAQSGYMEQLRNILDRKKNVFPPI